MVEDDGTEGAQRLAFSGGELSRGRCDVAVRSWPFCRTVRQVFARNGHNDLPWRRLLIAGTGG